MLFKKEKVLKLVGYSDSGWAGCINDMKSTSRHFFTLGSSVFCWSSKKQQTVAQSTAEAKYIAAAIAVNQAIWLRKLLHDLNENQCDPTKIMVDNQSAVAIAKNPVFHGKIKHFKIKFHFVREAEQSKEVSLVHCCSQDQLADILTKPLGTARGLLLNLTHLRDDSSPETWNYSVWIRGYALYLEERAECFNALKYDVDKDQSRNRRLNTPDLLDQLPVLQELLHHLLNCKVHTLEHTLHFSYTSNILYVAITDGILNLIDKMQHHHAVRALEIYRKAGEQLSEVFEICRVLHYGQGQKYLKIKPETPEVLALPYTSITKDEGAAPTETPAPVSDLLTDDVQEKSVTSSDKTQSESRQAVGKLDIADLICFDEPSEEGTELNENNPLALAIVKSENPPNAESVGSSAPAFTGWELGLCDAPVSNGAAVADNKMTGSTNTLTPHSLSTTNQQMAYNFGQVSANPFDDYNSEGPFYGSSSIPPEANVQTAAMPQQLPYIMPQQPPMTMVAYHSISPSAVANYNQIPTFYGGSNLTLSTDMKKAVIAPPQTELKQQPTLAMVGYNSTKPSRNPFDM
ncbi:hypothetical protein V6Z11_A05G387800 [Gossypium hirsutum]